MFSEEQFIAQCFETDDFRRAIELEYDYEELRPIIDAYVAEKLASYTIEDFKSIVTFYNLNDQVQNEGHYLPIATDAIEGLCPRILWEYGEKTHSVADTLDENDDIDDFE
jgi:hypothetical protein